MSNNINNNNSVEMFDGNSFNAVELFAEYTALVKSRALKFLNVGCELEDLIQEGNIGLLYAARKYDGNRSSFSTFAYKCIDAAIIDYLRKNSKLSAVPSECLVDIDFVKVADESSDPEAVLFSKDEYNSIVEKANSVLSNRELAVFNDIILGYSYDEISVRNNMNSRAVNNAVQRIRTKLK